MPVLNDGQKVATDGYSSDRAIIESDSWLESRRFDSDMRRPPSVDAIC